MTLFPMFPQGLASYDDIVSWLCVLSDLPMVDLVRHPRRVFASISILYVSAITLHDGAASDGLSRLHTRCPSPSPHLTVVSTSSACPCRRRCSASLQSFKRRSMPARRSTARVGSSQMPSDCHCSKMVNATPSVAGHNNRKRHR